VTANNYALRLTKVMHCKRCWLFIEHDENLIEEVMRPQTCHDNGCKLMIAAMSQPVYSIVIGMGDTLDPGWP
jgi:hypothetical protein